MKTRIRIRGDVDAGAARGLGVAADRVDVATERRPLGDERPDEERTDDEEQSASGTPRSLFRIQTVRNAITGTTTSFSASRSGSRIGMPCRRPASAPQPQHHRRRRPTLSDGRP